MGGCFTKKVSAEERLNTDVDEDDPDNSFGQYRNDELDAFGQPRNNKPVHKLMGKDVSHIKLPPMHLNLDELPRPDSIDVSNNYDPAESRRMLREIIET
jgi:hypothetical protein